MALIAWKQRPVTAIRRVGEVIVPARIKGAGGIEQGYLGQATIGNDGVVSYTGYDDGYDPPCDYDPPLDEINYIRWRDANTQVQMNLVGNAQPGGLTEILMDIFAWSSGPYVLTWNGSTLYVGNITAADRDAATAATGQRGTLEFTTKPPTVFRNLVVGHSAPYYGYSLAAGAGSLAPVDLDGHQLVECLVFRSGPRQAISVETATVGPHFQSVFAEFDIEGEVYGPFQCLWSAVDGDYRTDAPGRRLYNAMRDNEGETVRVKLWQSS